MLRAVSLVGALVLGAGVALAAQANADAATDDYLGWLNRGGYSYTSEQDAIDFGFAACDKMSDGQFDSVEADVRGSGVFNPPPGMERKVMSSTLVLCPDVAEAWAHWDLATRHPDFVASNHDDPDFVREWAAIICDRIDGESPICDARDWGPHPSESREDWLWTLMYCDDPENQDGAYCPIGPFT